MKIGIIGDALDRQYAGIHIYTKNLVDHLVKVDLENEYFLFREKASVNPSFHEIVIPVFKWIPGYQSFRLLFAIPTLARKYNLDVVVEPAHFGPFNLPKSIKRVTVIHDLTPILFPEWHTFNGWFLQKLFLPGIVKRADLIITNSEYTKSDIVNHMHKDPAEIIPIHLGISDRFYRRKNLAVLKEYGIYKPYILYLGTLEPRKNLIGLIKAVELFKERNPHAQEQLILTGKKGWKIKELLRNKYQSRYHHDIILLGYAERDHLPHIYSGATFFIYPSFYEGFGIPVLEALACGVPVLASKSTSLPEVGGKHVHYFDPSDVNDMANTMHIVFHGVTGDNKESMEYAQSFTWERMATRFKSSIEKLAEVS